jgi:hypothetical protein
MSPLSEKVHSLIIFQHILMFFKIVGSHRLQVAGDMSSVVGCEVCRGVIPMIILWSKIYNSKHDLIATGFRRLNNGLSHCELF